MITQKQIHQKIKEANARYVRLLSGDGSKTIVAANNPKVKINERVKQICDALKTDMNPDGKYIIELKNSPTVDGYQWEIWKGKPGETLHEPSPAQTQNTEVEKVRSFNAALEDKKSLSDLQHEVERLKSQLALYETDDDDVDLALLDGTFPDMNESWLKDFAALIPSISDRYFNIREKELSLKEKAMQLKQPSVNPLDRAISIYNDLCEKQDVDAITQYMNSLQGQYPQVFEQLTQLINEQGGA